MSVTIAEPCATRIKKALSIRNMTQTELCAKTKISKSSLSEYLSGKYIPRQDKIFIIAQALNVDPVWLWGYDVPMERSEGQKKNDQLVKLVTRLRSDSEFMDAVQKLDNLTPAQYDAIISMLKAMS